MKQRALSNASCPLRKVTSPMASPPAREYCGFILSCIYEERMLSSSLCATFLKYLFRSILLLLRFEGICHEWFPWLRGYGCSWSGKSVESKWKNQCIWDRVNVLCIRNGHFAPVRSRYEIGKIDVILNPLVLPWNAVLLFTIVFLDCWKHSDFCGPLSIKGQETGCVAKYTTKPSCAIFLCKKENGFFFLIQRCTLPFHSFLQTKWRKRTEFWKRCRWFFPCLCTLW